MGGIFQTKKNARNVMESEKANIASSPESGEVISRALIAKAKEQTRPGFRNLFEEHEELRQAFRLYGSHLIDCTFDYNSNFHCSCGLFALKKKYEHRRNNR